MSPIELATRIAALDWSACSLQQQLAVAAAISTLRVQSLQPQQKESPMSLEPLPVNDNIIALVPKRAARTMRHVTLLHLDGRLLATAGFLPGDPGAPWAWIQECVAESAMCEEEDIGCMEPPEDEGGGDLVTVEGIPYCRVRIGSAPARG